MTTLLIIGAAVAVYALFVLASPSAACRACRGWGAKERRRRRKACRRCGGTGVRFRPGARLAHRAAAALTRSRMTSSRLPVPPWRPPRDRP